MAQEVYVVIEFDSETDEFSKVECVFQSKEDAEDFAKECNARYMRYSYGCYEGTYDADAVLAEKDKEIAELKERSQWHRQKDKDIYFECGKHWGAEYIIKMKDGSTHLAYGGCDEGGDGSVSTYLHFQDDDYELKYDDIDMWYEIPDHKVVGNIKESR